MYTDWGFETLYPGEEEGWRGGQRGERADAFCTSVGQPAVEIDLVTLFYYHRCCILFVENTIKKSLSALYFNLVVSEFRVVPSEGCLNLGIHC